MSDITVDLITPQGEVLDQTSIPPQYLVRQIIDEFVDHIGLPRFLEGQPVDYTLRWVSRNMNLDPQTSLVDAGVQHGDQLKLVSSVPLDMPGGSPRETFTQGGYAPPQQPYDTFRTTQPPGSFSNTVTNVGDTTVEVLLSVLDLNRNSTEFLELDMPISQLIVDIARRSDLPDRDELNVETTYRMKSKALGRMLGPTETLRTAGVPKHDRLAILREEIAG